MKFEHRLHVRPALMAVAATVVMSAVTSPTMAAADVEAGPTAGDATQVRGQVAVVRRPSARFRGRYQLRLPEARRLLGA